VAARRNGVSRIRAAPPGKALMTVAERPSESAAYDNNMKFAAKISQYLVFAQGSG
jgi:hypothetical protein